MTCAVDARRDSTTRIACALLAAALVAGTGGCVAPTVLSETPNVLRDGSGLRALQELPANLQHPEMQILYATDREAAGKSAAGVGYGYTRSQALAFGSAVVTMNPRPTWDELVKDTSAPAGPSRALSVQSVAEVGTMAWPVQQLEAQGDHLRLEPDAVAHNEEGRRLLRAALRDRLARAPHRDVYIFVHGFNVSFDEGVAETASLWHCLGRRGVPVVYSWPSGHGGLRGYAYDRESSEFTVFHFKEFLRTVADCPEVERVHIIAHSRGADVAIAGLRELAIDCRARGLDPRARLKLETLVLAAPDIDPGVFAERFALEDMVASSRRTVIYYSPRDKALALATLFFDAFPRLGEMTWKDVPPEVRTVIAKVPALQLIECDVTGSGWSHDYAFTSPAVLSDLILVLRDRQDPGPSRPLGRIAEGLWQITDGYPNAPAGR